MSKEISSDPERTPQQDAQQPGVIVAELQRNEQSRSTTRESIRWWVKLIVQPALFLSGFIVLLLLVGFVQKSGLLVSQDEDVADQTETQSDEPKQQYICPMMCVAPTTEPGRCPVCAMELVLAATGNAGNDGISVHIDSETRRVLNIQTTLVLEKAVMHKIRSVGDLGYNESQLKTLSAWVDGRVEKLYANYTGVVVNQGDQLALIYSPRLYSSQVELLSAKRMQTTNRSASSGANIIPTVDLYASAHRRLVELGMTENQIQELEQGAEANSRLHLVAPISGTVIEKLAVEGEYVEEGDVIYRLADLTSVWLMLRLFPEDAALVRLGQTVEAEVQSLPGKIFTGQVDFIFPNVDPTSRTVGVRVLIPNLNGQLRIGDYARATIDVPVHSLVDESGQSDTPSSESRTALVVPRDAVLMAGQNSVLYVETEPGRFEIRNITVGPTIGREVVILQGVEAGESVATRGNFLIDSQMQLTANPSLIDPWRAIPQSPENEFEIMPQIPPMGDIKIVPKRPGSAHEGH